MKENDKCLHCKIANMKTKKIQKRIVEIPKFMHFCDCCQKNRLFKEIYVKYYGSYFGCNKCKNAINFMPLT